jgi:hypothetical protein
MSLRKRRRRCDGVVVGMIVRGDEAERYRIVGRPLQLAARKHSVSTRQNNQPAVTGRRGPEVGDTACRQLGKADAASAFAGATCGLTVRSLVHDTSPPHWNGVPLAPRLWPAAVGVRPSFESGVDTNRPPAPNGSCAPLGLARGRSGRRGKMATCKSTCRRSVCCQVSGRSAWSFGPHTDTYPGGSAPGTSAARVWIALSPSRASSIRSGQCDRRRPS